MPSSAVEPEAVFERTEDPVGIVAVAFKLQNRIHHVLEYLGACNRSVFGDVADQEYRVLVSLAKRCSSAAVSRIWLMLPGLLST